MVDWKILKEKIEKVSTILNVTKWIGIVILIVNILGWVYNKIDLTIFLSVIFIVLFWVWALDAQVSRIENILKDKRIMKRDLND